MLNLPTVASLLQLVNGAAVSTLAVHASFIDLQIAGTTVNPGSRNTIVTTFGTTVIVPPPPAGLNRNVKFISVQNTGALPCPVAIQHFNGSIAVNLFAMISCPLSPGWTIQYNTDGNGFIVYDEIGNIQEILGT